MFRVLVFRDSGCRVLGFRFRLWGLRGSSYLGTCFQTVFMGQFSDA